MPHQRLIAAIDTARDNAVHNYITFVEQFMPDGVRDKQDWERVESTIRLLRTLAEALIDLASTSSHQSYTMRDLPEQVRISFELAQKYERLITLDAKDRGLDH